MGKLGRFFKKIGSSIKTGVVKAAKFVGKIAKPVMKIGRQVLPLLSLAPGVPGNVARVANTALSVADNAINQLPDSKIKSKLQEVSGVAGKKIAETHEKAADLAERAKTIGEKAQQTIKAGNVIVDGFKPAARHVCKSQAYMKKAIEHAKQSMKPQVI